MACSRDLCRLAGASTVGWETPPSCMHVGRSQKTSSSAFALAGPGRLFLTSAPSPGSSGGKAKQDTGWKTLSPLEVSKSLSVSHHFPSFSFNPALSPEVPSDMLSILFSHSPVLTLGKVPLEPPSRPFLCKYSFSQDLPHAVPVQAGPLNVCPPECAQVLLITQRKNG